MENYTSLVNRIIEEIYIMGKKNKSHKKLFFNDKIKCNTKHKRKNPNYEHLYNINGKIIMLDNNDLFNLLSGYTAMRLHY